MPAKKIYILVVEDDPCHSRKGYLTSWLSTATHRKESRTAPKDSEQPWREDFDLVILDVMLPGLDGFSICKELRAKKPNQAILMLTAKGGESDVVTGFRTGADDYVRKPFSLRELLVRVEALLRRSGKIPTPEQLTIGGLVFDGENLLLKNGEAQDLFDLPGNGNHRLPGSQPGPDHIPAGASDRGLAVRRPGHRNPDG